MTYRSLLDSGEPTRTSDRSRSEPKRMTFALILQMMVVTMQTKLGRLFETTRKKCLRLTSSLRSSLRFLKWPRGQLSLARNPSRNGLMNNSIPESPIDHVSCRHARFMVADNLIDRCQFFEWIPSFVGRLYLGCFRCSYDIVSRGFVHFQDHGLLRY